MDENLTSLSNDAVTVHAGFPNPAVDRLNKNRSLDLNKLLIRHPSSTYLFQIHGNQWETSGVFDGDTALIDRALEPKTHDIVVVWQASGFIVCRHDQVQRNDTFWGVVTATIHQLRT